MKIKLGKSEYEIKEPCFEIEAQVENNTIEMVGGAPQYKNGIGHAKIVRAQLYLIRINEDQSITEDKVKRLNPEHASVILNVIDGMPVQLAEAKYKNLQKLKAKQIEIEEKELEKINKKLQEDETEPTLAEKSD